eukprot:gene2343-8645_t
MQGCILLLLVPLLTRNAVRAVPIPPASLPPLGNSIIGAHFDFEAPGTLWAPTPDDFLGLSSSYQSMFRVMSDPVFQQMMKNLFAYGKKDAIAFRSMGVTKTPKRKQWHALADASRAFPVKYILQIPLYLSKNPNQTMRNNYPGVTIVNDSVSYLGKDRIMAYTAGNEPDWFANNRGWDVKEYMASGGFYDRDFTLVEESVGPEIKKHFNGSCRKIGGPNTANLWIWRQERAKEFMEDHPCMSLLTNHYYAINPKTSKYTDLLLNEAVDNAYWMSVAFGEAAKSVGGAFRVTEIGSAYSGGVWGISDRLAAALWTLDLSLTFAYHGTAGVHFNGAGCTSYSPFHYGNCSNQIASGGDEGPGMRASAPYYGMLMFQRALGAGAFIYPIDVQLKDQWLPARVWGIKPRNGSDLSRRVLIINRGWWTPGEVEITLAGNYSQAKVCRLAAGSHIPWDRKMYATGSQMYMCGQQVGPSGNLVGNFYLETPKMSQTKLASGKILTTFTVWADPVNAMLLETKIRSKN